MMAGIMSYFSGRRDPKLSAREAIVTLRQQLQMIERKEEYLQKKIEQETNTARANAVSNRAVATAALRRKKASEVELDRLGGTRLQMEMQVNTLESANLNAETIAAMKKAADALKVIHGNLTLDKADATMASVNEQRDIANEIAEIISNPYGQSDLDDGALADELAELEQEVLDERLTGAERVPSQRPETAGKAPVAAEPESDDEEEQLRQLQAELAM